MLLIKNPKALFVLLLLAALSIAMLLIIRRHANRRSYQQKIDFHSEIVDTI